MYLITKYCMFKVSTLKNSLVLSFDSSFKIINRVLKGLLT